MTNVYRGIIEQNGRRTVLADDKQLRPRLDDTQRLANRGHDRGRQRRREHVGAHGHTQDVEVGIVRHAVATDRTQGLGEGADDEMAIVENAGRFAEAATGLAERAQRMSFIDQHVGEPL